MDIGTPDCHRAKMAVAIQTATARATTVFMETPNGEWFSSLRENRIGAVSIQRHEEQVRGRR